MYVHIIYIYIHIIYIYTYIHTHTCNCLAFETHETVIASNKLGAQSPWVIAF